MILKRGVSYVIRIHREEQIYTVHNLSLYTDRIGSCGVQVDIQSTEFKILIL